MTVQLELRGVRAGYGSVDVLLGLSLWLPHGGVAALVGPNGVGKTTTLRVLAGTLPVRSGAVLWDGEDVSALTPYQRARRGMVLIPERQGVFQGLSVRDNFLVFAGDDEPGRLDPVLALFPVLGQRLTQLAGSLSGGEQQMLALTRALLQRPRVLLLDEISLGLAPKVVAELFEAVQGLRDESMSVVLVEQYRHRVTEIADVVYLLKHGTVTFVGDPSELAGRRTQPPPPRRR